MRATPIFLLVLILSLTSCSGTDSRTAGGTETGSGEAAPGTRTTIPFDTVRRPVAKRGSGVHDTVIIWNPKALRNSLITHYDGHCYKVPLPEDCAPIESDSVRKP